MRKPTARSIHRQKGTETKPVQLSTEPERVENCAAAIRRTKSPREAGDLVIFRRDIYPAALAQVSESERQRFLKLLSLDV